MEALRVVARSPLSYPAFRVLWLAAIVTFLGSFVQNVAEAWVMMDLTKSPLPVATLSTAFVGASFLMTLPGGVLADRYDRRSVAVVSQIVQASAALGMAVLSFTGHITPVALVVGVSILGLGMALGVPAWTALIPDLVPRELVADAVALNAVAFNLARAVGPALGGLVLAKLGATASFALNAASFFVVIAALVLHRSADERPPPSSRSRLPRGTTVRPLGSAFVEPWRVVRSDEAVRPAFIAMLPFSLGAGMFYALTPAFGKTTLGATPLSYGMMIGAMGAGAVLGATILKPLRQLVHPRALVTTTMLFFATGSAVVANVSTVTLAMILFVPAGVGWLGTFSSLSALVQVWAPDEVRARVIALYSMAHLATWATAASLGGVVADRIGIRVAMMTGALVCAASAFVTWKLGLPPSFSGVRVAPQPPPPPE
jgi:MFS family permease